MQKLIQRFLPVLVTTLLVLPVTAPANVSVTLGLWHGYDFYYHYFSLSPWPTNAHHRIESEDGTLWQNYGTNNASGGSSLTNNLDALVERMTNGVWKLYLNRDTPSATTNYFTVTLSNVTTHLFGDVQILFPMDGSSDIPNQPDFHWTGPGEFPEIWLSLSDTLSSYNDFATLPGTATNWTPTTPMPAGGEVDLLVQYATNAHPAVTLSTPTNSAGIPLAGWSSQGNLRSYRYSFFTVQTGGTVSAELFGHYTFDNEFFPEEDSSASGNHATGTFYAGGGTQPPQYSLDGVAGGAIEFDGYNAMYWDTNLVNLLGGSYTLSLWVQTVQSYGFNTDEGYDGAAILAGDPFLGDFPVPMALTGDVLAFYTAAPDDTLHSGTSINSGSFTHLVVTRDAATGAKKIYVDGALDSSGTGGTSPGIDSEEIYLGYSFYSDQGLAGVVDDLQIYSGVLDPGQIAYLYNNPGMTAPNLGNPLGEAVDAPALVWTTGGNAPWFAQTNFTSDGVDAAQSGLIGDYQESWIETAVEGPGYVRFQWGVDGDDFSYDRLEFAIDGFTETDLSGLGDYWNYEEWYVDSGTHTLRWTYLKDSFSSDGEDAGWLDEVEFLPEIEVNLELSIERSESSSETNFLLFPFLSYVSPSPVSSHEVESPTGLFSGDTSGSSSVNLDSFQDLIDECEAGDWTLYINRNDPSERRYTFTVTFTGLSSNDLPPATILSPANGATGIATNHTFLWSGPTNWNSLFLNSYLPNGGGTSGGFTSLPPTTVSAMAPNPLALGSNAVYVSYTLLGATGVELSDPVDASLNNLYSWSYEVNLRSRTEARFSVEAGSTTVPVTILDPQHTGTAFVFSMQTQDGKAHVVQCRTNLPTAPWVDLTNFTGDGNLKLLQLPLGTNAETYYRVGTQ